MKPSERIDQIYKNICRVCSVEYGYWLGGGAKSSNHYLMAVVQYLDEEHLSKNKENA